MKQNITKLIKHPLIMGSSVIFIGSLVASLINYFFNLLMGRFLSPADYGTFASLISIFNIFAVFYVVVMMIFAKFSASLVGQKKEKAIGSLFISGSIWVSIISLAVCFLLAVFSPKISDFLKIDSVILVLITILALFFTFLTGVANGILQGLLKFNYFSFVNIVSSAVKLLLGIGFAFLGYKLHGAVIAFLVSSIFGYLFAFLPLYKFMKYKVDDGFTLSSLHKKAYSYALPVFLSNIGITAFITVDIILVKHYFSPVVAGQYAALSLMGRSIFYVVSPISSVLFPLIAQKKERKERLTGTLLLSIILIGLPSLFLSFIYFVFPNLVLGLFFPSSSYASLSQYLGPFSLFILFYGLSYLMNSFYLSIGNVKVLFFTIIAAIAEAVSIILFHGSIIQVIYGLMATTFLLLFSLLLYYPHATKDSNS